MMDVTATAPLSVEFVENVIESALHNLRLASPVKATLEQPQILLIQKEQRMWAQTCHELNAQLQELDAQGRCETAGLYLNMKPMLQHLDHLNQILETCRVFKELASRLMAELTEVKEASISLTKQILPYNLPKFEQGLESFIDRCDQVADQLDALENQGHNVSALVKRYEQWVAMVEQFGDILDERTDALVLKPKTSTI